VPLAPLFDDAPLYDRPWVQPTLHPRLDPGQIPAPTDWNAAVLKVVGCPDMASKRWLWEQYDRHVMADTLEDSATGCDAGIVRIHGKGKAIAVTSDVTPRYVQNDPYEGGKQAVAEAWRNLTAAGSLPIAITDNLNFGSPEKPETMGQIVRATDGMAEACRALDFPVVSGNVSLYNETNGVAIPPTPTVGAVGLLEDYDLRMGFGNVAEGDTLVLIGESHGELGASIYLREILGREDGAPPPVDLAAERKNGDFVRGLIPTGLVAGLHDLSDGGLLIAAADMALASKVGITLNATSHAHAHPYLFGEDQARYLIATPDPDAVLAAAKEAGVHANLAGVAGGNAFASIPLDALRTDLFSSFGGSGPAGALLGLALRTAHEAWLPGFMDARSGARARPSTRSPGFLLTIWSAILPEPSSCRPT
jgi:phosphoribosylformylglycinamidine (FGAM) synthase-like enzyme